MANLERETEEALGLPPRAKETKPTVQEYMDDTGAMGLLTGPMSRGSGLLGGATAAYQFGRDLLGFNEQADDRALAGRKDDEGITPTKNYIYDLAIDKLGATPYQAQTVAMLAEATPIAGEYLGIEETANLIKEGRYKDAALSGAGTAAGIIPFIGDAAKAALRRGVDPEVVNQIIAGKGAKDFYGDDLRKAVELEERGFSPEEIEEITGRFTVGSAEADYLSEPLMVRGKPKPYFKFEIDDSDVLIKSNDGNITLKETSPSQPVNVGDIIDHPKLFAQYPEAKNVQFYFDASEDGGAYFDPSKGPRGSIVISGSRKDTDVSNMSLKDGRDFRKSFFHELQHAIQWQDKKIKGLEQIAGSPTGYMKTVAKPEKAYKGDLYLKKLGQNTKLINIKDKILELYQEGKKTNSWDFSSKLKIIDSDNKMLPEPVEIKEFYNNPESAKKIAKLMRDLEQESFRTYIQAASEIEARAVGYRAIPHPYQSLPPIVPEIDKQKKIETSEEAYENTPNKPIQQAKNRAIYKLKPMTDEEISRYAQGAVNFAKYAEGVEPELKGFSDWGPTQKGFAQGGVAMKDQMEMNFGQAETVDPVSGNNVPPGSLPEEVRDDIPARLSEGEYVVPADVVRYYGVKFFEDLRTQAKMGLQQMDADGRIGGEPMEPQQAELSDDDLNSIIEQAMQQEQPMMANEGGVVGYYSGGGNFDYLGGSIFGPQEKAIDTTVANQFYDPDVGGYKPTTGPYGPDPQAAPVVAAARVADPVCPTGFRYDRNQGRCVPKSEGPDVVNQTVNTGGIKFGKDFGKSVDWNDATAVQEFALGTPGDSTKSGLNTPFKPFGLDKKSQNQLAGAALLVGGVNPVSLLAGAATRIYQNVDATKDLAGLRASEIIAYAKGHNEVGGKINKAIGQYVEQAGKGYSNKSGLLKNIVGTGYNYASEVLGVKKEDLKNFMSIVDNANSTEIEVAAAQEALQAKMKQTKELVQKSSEIEKDRKQEQITAAQQAVLTAQKTPIQSGRLEKMLGVPSQGRPARDSEGNDLSGLDPTDLNWEEVRQLRSHDSAANRQKLAEWEAASGKEGSSGAQAGSKGCFLTTAIVEHRGEADDGPTLTKLRNFRDTYLVNYPEEVKKYYQVAPKIVAAIPKDNPTWDWVGKQIDSAIKHIDNNMLDKAHETYKSMVLELETNWLKKA